MADSVNADASARRVVGFALGGLGGSNAHGAGFLNAARGLGMKPDIISCTSGQIHWTAAFLAGEALEEKMERHVKAVPRLPEPFGFLTAVMVGMGGLPGVFRPAMIENWLRMPGAPSSLDREALFSQWFPARTWIHTRPRADYEHMAKVFNGSDVGVIFNTYNPATGIEYLHINDAARPLLEKEFDKRYDNKEFLPITTEYVEAAHWLMQYGFEKEVNGEPLIDGAYRRQVIVSELDCADVVFIPAPISRSWKGSLPTNTFQLEDFKLELLFTGSYNGELAAVRWVNHLLERGWLDATQFRPTEIVEIPITVNRGFFDYFLESEEVFQDATKTGKEVLQTKLGLAQPEAAPAAGRPVALTA